MHFTEKRGRPGADGEPREETRRLRKVGPPTPELRGCPLTSGPVLPRARLLQAENGTVGVGPARRFGSDRLRLWAGGWVGAGTVPGPAVRWPLGGLPLEHWGSSQVVQGETTPPGLLGTLPWAHGEAVMGVPAGGPSRSRGQRHMCGPASELLRQGPDTVMGGLPAGCPVPAPGLSVWEPGNYGRCGDRGPQGESGQRRGDAWAWGWCLYGWKRVRERQGGRKGPGPAQEPREQVQPEGGRLATEAGVGWGVGDRPSLPRQQQAGCGWPVAGTCWTLGQHPGPPGRRAGGTLCGVSSASFSLC